MTVLKTKWTDTVDNTCPRNEYPRPQLVRDEWLCLNGEYEYAVTPEQSSRPARFDGKITVPFAIECLLSGVGRRIDENDRLWYRRYFTVPDSFKGKTVLLHFEAVDWQCEVWVNSVRAGGHTGGYCPFTFDITDLLIDGENELIVKVYDPTDAGWQQRGKQFHKSVGFWYTATSGIWQPVWLEAVNADYIEKIKITPDIDKKCVFLKTDIKGGGALSAKILKEGEVIFEGSVEPECEIPVEDMRLWSPEDPFLYDLELTLTNGSGSDTVKSYFGMRKYSIGKDKKGLPRIMLNNEPYFMNGLLDQGYWPDGGLTAPTDDAMIFDIEKMKELGFNMLRKHIKTEPHRWYYHCDRLGMIVWQDMMSGGKPLNLIYAGAFPNINVHVRDNQYKMFNRDKPEWREQFKEELFEMIDSLYNFTSIACWVPFNEGWGQFDAKEIGESVKKYDPTRVVDHASGWHDQGGPDFKSVHKYIFPVHLPTERRKAGRPFVLSEFGGYSRTIEGHVWNFKKSFGYIKFSNEKTLTQGYQRLFNNQIIPLIEKGLSATVYTQVSDVEFEVNGIYTYDRKILKLDASTIKAINKKMKY
ncbi:MAG: glycoside hydrolase family 2 [Clostridia bacterium]|nr:glycoside hydrolase family 2 [Clostridia bacterium]